MWQDQNRTWHYSDNIVWTEETSEFLHPAQPEIFVRMSSSREPDTSWPPSTIQEIETLRSPEEFQQYEVSSSPENHQEPATGKRKSHSLVSFSLNYGPTVLSPAPAGTISQGSSSPKRSVKKSLCQRKNKFKFIGWNDEAKMMLYRWRRVLKKGPSAFMHHFPGETEESLREAWEKYSDEGMHLYKEWKATAQQE